MPNSCLHSKNQVKINEPNFCLKKSSQRATKNSSYSIKQTDHHCQTVAVRLNLRSYTYWSRGLPGQHWSSALGCSPTSQQVVQQARAPDKEIVCAQRVFNSPLP